MKIGFYNSITKQDILPIFNDCNCFVVVFMKLTVTPDNIHRL